MNYQKIKNQDDFSNSIVKEGDLLTFFSKDQNGKISLICKDSSGQFKKISGDNSDINMQMLNEIYQILTRTNYNINYPFSVTEQNVFLISITKEQLGIQEAIELDVIDSQGYNITTDTRLTRRWNGDVYQLTMAGNWKIGNYILRSSNGNSLILNNRTDQPTLTQDTKVLLNNLDEQSGKLQDKLKYDKITQQQLLYESEERQNHLSEETKKYIVSVTRNSNKGKVDVNNNPLPANLIDTLYWDYSEIKDWNNKKQQLLYNNKNQLKWVDKSDLDIYKLEIDNNVSDLFDLEINSDTLKLTFSQGGNGIIIYQEGTLTRLEIPQTPSVLTFDGTKICWQEYGECGS